MKCLWLVVICIWELSLVGSLRHASSLGFHYYFGAHRWRVGVISESLYIFGCSALLLGVGIYLSGGEVETLASWFLCACVTHAHKELFLPNGDL